MGKATRWLRGLLGMKKDKENVENNSNYAEKRDRKRWSSGKSGKESERLSQIPANIPVTNWGWRRSYISKNRKEQNEHAIAVAAATAAAADAAVAAAQAAVAVVRLTSQGRGGLFNGGRERWAAIKIQSVFRGYLSRKALKALKGLVKLQALVRGYLVRKRAAATLHSMQVLVRAQATVRDRRSINTNYRFHPENRARNSTERFDKNRSEFHSKRLSKASNDPSLNAYDENPKIVEIDSYKPMSRSRRIYTCTSGYGNDHYYQETSSPLPCQIPARLPIPNHHHHQDFDYFFIREDSKLATAQSTPRFASSRPHAPVTPAKSVCGDSFFRPYTNRPSYMANTQSSKAKLRSLSAPKQRPESGLKRRLSLNEVMASRTSFSDVRMQQPCTQVQEDFGF